MAMARAEVTGKKPTVTADRAKRRPGRPRADPKAIEPTGHAEPDSSISVKTPPIRGPPFVNADGPKYRRKPPSVDPNLLAMSIKAFCALHAISEDQFFKMQRKGWGPVTMKVGSRTIISHEAAAEWRRQREQAAKEAAATVPAA
jgi:hypothetical protein